MGDVAEDTERGALAEQEEEGVIEGEVVEEAERARNLPAVREHEAMVARGEVSPDEVVAQREKIKQVMDAVMRKDVHYGEIPGVNKPTLLKPGAEVLAVTFRLAPSYRSERTFDGPHLTVVSRATLTHIPTGLVVAEGEGLCSTRESKYAYRGEGRMCPECGAAAIKKSKFAPREGDYDGASASDPPGWYCYSKVGGCGANFAADDQRIVGQETGRVENPDLPDQWNTVLKMANKRALVAAILNGTAASDIFTQDVEDAGRAAADTHEVVRDQVDRWIAPKGWGELASRLSGQLGADLAGAYMEELAEKAFGHPSLSSVVQDPEIADEDKRKLGRRLNAVLRVFETSEDVPPAGLPFMPGLRQFIAGTIYESFEGEVAVVGPPWALGPDEIEAGIPAKDATAQEAVSGDATPGDVGSQPDGPEAASAAEDAPETPSPAPAGDDVVDKDGNPIEF
jgi:hypothetical protein